MLPVKPSAIELEQLEQTVSSAGYELIRQKIEREIRRVIEEGFNATKWDEFLAARGYMKGLKLALALPEIMKREITEKLAKEAN